MPREPASKLQAQRKLLRDLGEAAITFETSLDLELIRKALLLLSEHPGFLVRRNQIRIGTISKSMTPQQWAGMLKNQYRAAEMENVLRDFLRDSNDKRPPKCIVDDAIAYMRKAGVARIPKDHATIEKEIRRLRKQMAKET